MNNLGLMVLPIASIRLDFQGTECLSYEIVAKYIEDVCEERKLDPVEVRIDGAEYWLQDGFHRVAALTNWEFPKSRQT